MKDYVNVLWAILAPCTISAGVSLAQETRTPTRDQIEQAQKDFSKVSGFYNPAADPNIKEKIHWFSLQKPATNATVGKLSGITVPFEFGLSLIDSSITDEGLKSLKPLANLRYLDLRKTAVTDEGMKHINELKDLRYLNLLGTKVTRAGLKELKDLKNLQLLMVPYEQVTDATLKDLRDVGLLHAFYVCSGVDGKRPTKIEEIASVNLGTGKFTAESLKELTTLPKLRSLSVSKDTTNEKLQPVEGMANLRYLSLGSSSVNDDGLKHLRGLKDLEILDLRFSKATGSGLSDLKHLTQLKTLYIEPSQVTDDGLKGLCDAALLQALSFTKEDGIGSPRLKDYPILNLEFCKISDAGLKHIADQEELRAIYLNHTKITDEGLKSLKALTKLESLQLRKTEVTDTGMTELKDMLSLQVLVLDGTKVTDRGLRELKALKELVHVNLGGCDITDDGLKSLSLGKVTKLVVDGTKVSDVGMKQIGALGNLRELYIGNTGVTDVGLKELHGLQKLLLIDLFSTQTTAGGVRDFQRALPFCKVFR